MEIVKAYRTSKGTFFSKEDASKRKNRETYGYGKNDQDQWESVCEVMLLKDGNYYFALNRVEVKRSE